MLAAACHGVNYPDFNRRAASLVNKIINGVNLQPMLHSKIDYEAVDWPV